MSRSPSPRPTSPRSRGTGLTPGGPRPVALRRPGRHPHRPPGASSSVSRNLGATPDGRRHAVPHPHRRCRHPAVSAAGVGDQRPLTGDRRPHRAGRHPETGTFTLSFDTTRRRRHLRVRLHRRHAQVGGVSAPAGWPSPSRGARRRQRRADALTLTGQVDRAAGRHAARLSERHRLADLRRRRSRRQLRRHPVRRLGSSGSTLAATLGVDVDTAAGRLAVMAPGSPSPSAALTLHRRPRGRAHRSTPPARVQLTAPDQRLADPPQPGRLTEGSGSLVASAGSSYAGTLSGTSPSPSRASSMTGTLAVGSRHRRGRAHPEPAPAWSIDVAGQQLSGDLTITSHRHHDDDHASRTPPSTSPAACSPSPTPTPRSCSPAGR